MAETITTRVLRSTGGTPNGAGITVVNDSWSWGGQARTNAGQLFVSSTYNSSTLRGQIDYAPGSLLGTLSGTRTSGNLSFTGAINSNGLMTGSGTFRSGNSSFGISTASGLTSSYSWPGLGNLTAGLNPASDTWSLTFNGTRGTWGFNFGSGFSQSGGWNFNMSIFSTEFL